MDTTSFVTLKHYVHSKFILFQEKKKNDLNHNSESSVIAIFPCILFAWLHVSSSSTRHGDSRLHHLAVFPHSFSDHYETNRTGEDMGDKGTPEHKEERGSPRLSRATHNLRNQEPSACLPLRWPTSLSSLLPLWTELEARLGKCCRIRRKLDNLERRKKKIPNFFSHDNGKRWNWKISPELGWDKIPCMPITPRCSGLLLCDSV